MNNHFRPNKHDLVYTLSQPEMRDYLTAKIVLPSEEFIKYVYDGYTYEMGIRPIRKQKTRKKVQLEFHNAGYSKENAQIMVNKAIKYTFALN